MLLAKKLVANISHCAYPDLRGALVEKEMKVRGIRILQGSLYPHFLRAAFVALCRERSVRARGQFVRTFRARRGHASLWDTSRRLISGHLSNFA